MSSTITDAFELAHRAARVITEAFSGNHDLIVVLGSGWADATAMLGEGPELSVAEIPTLGGGGAGKVLYVWFDAPIGYISATNQWAIDNQ